MEYQMIQQLITLTTFFLLILSLNANAEDKKGKDCTDKQQQGVIKVKMLDDFANTMHELWHDGWVNKDYSLIKNLYPKADEFVKNLESNNVPEGMEDRAEKWGRGVKALRISLNNVKIAIDENNEKQLVDEIEKFHQIYELMVSMTKPYVKEVEDFHKAMAKMYHRNYPDFNLEEMSNDIRQMYTVLDALDKTKLPKYYSAKEKEFRKIVKELRKSVKDLEKYMAKNKNLTKDDTNLKDKVEKLHTDFHTLSELFD